MTQIDVLFKIRELICRRKAALEQEKIDHPEDTDVCRMMADDLNAILAAVDDSMPSSKARPHTFLGSESLASAMDELVDEIGPDPQMKAAMERDSSDGPVADSVDGYRILPGEE